MKRAADAPDVLERNISSSLSVNQRVAIRDALIETSEQLALCEPHRKSNLLKYKPATNIRRSDNCSAHVELYDEKLGSTHDLFGSITVGTNDFTRTIERQPGEQAWAGIGTNSDAMSLLAGLPNANLSPLMDQAHITDDDLLHFIRHEIKPHKNHLVEKTHRELYGVEYPLFDSLASTALALVRIQLEHMEFERQQNKNGRVRQLGRAVRLLSFRVDEQLLIGNTTTVQQSYGAIIDLQRDDLTVKTSIDHASQYASYLDASPDSVTTALQTATDAMRQEVPRTDSFMMLLQNGFDASDTR